MPLTPGHVPVRRGRAGREAALRRRGRGGREKTGTSMRRSSAFEHSNRTSRLGSAAVERGDRRAPVVVRPDAGRIRRFCRRRCLVGAGPSDFPDSRPRPRSSSSSRGTSFGQRMTVMPTLQDGYAYGGALATVGLPTPTPTKEALSVTAGRGGVVKALPVSASCDAPSVDDRGLWTAGDPCFRQTKPRVRLLQGWNGGCSGRSHSSTFIVEHATSVRATFRQSKSATARPHRGKPRR